MLFVCSLVSAGSITDNFTTGDTLTAAKITAIKNAVNDNDNKVTINTSGVTNNTGNISTNSANIDINEGNISSNTTNIGTITNTTITSLAARVAALEASALTSRSKQMGYQWVSSFFTDTASASATYTYNSSGGTNTVSSSSAGNYTVVFDGLGNTNEGGFAMASSYNFTDVNCHVTSWDTTTAAVNVSCFNSDGIATNSDFTVIYID